MKRFLSPDDQILRHIITLPVLLFSLSSTRQDRLEYNTAPREFNSTLPNILFRGHGITPSR